MDYQKILEEIYTEIQQYAGIGAQADYIPALAKVDPDQFGMALTTVDGESYQCQNAEAFLCPYSPKCSATFFSISRMGRL